MSPGGASIGGDSALGVDAYVDPATGLLRTLADRPLRTAEQLRRFEDDWVEFRAIGLTLTPIDGDFDLAHLRAVHRALFQDVYEWAGELRTIGMFKGFHAHSGEPAHFAGVDAIEATVTAAHDELAAAGFLVGLDPWDFADALARPFNLVNLAHPFREGNGRAQRALWDQLAARAGHSINWAAFSGTEHGRIAQDARQSGDLAPLRAMLRAMVR